MDLNKKALEQLIEEEKNRRRINYYPLNNAYN